MNYKERKYYKKTLRKVAKAKPCPFCGGHLRLKWKVYPLEVYNGQKSVWHTAKIGCDCAMRPGASVSFSNNEGKQSPKLLWRSVSYEIDYWNKRVKKKLE